MTAGKVTAGKVTDEIGQLKAFLENGTSAFHVVRYARQQLEDAGFRELFLHTKEGGPWKLDRGGRYFCMPFATVLFAFTVGESYEPGRAGAAGADIRIAGAHTDFPAIKVKPSPELFRKGYFQLNTEVYGGPILNTFMDRPLSLSGRVIVQGKDPFHPASCLLDLKRPAAVIPNLAIHMNRSVNEKGSPVDNQKELLPILGMAGEELSRKGKFTKILAEELGVPAEDILDFDLCLYNTEKPVDAGIDGDLLLSPRLDDITSVSALVHGLIESVNRDHLNMVCLFDNEEIGSLSKQGADSALPLIVLGRIMEAFGRSTAEGASDLTGGMILSVDVAHASHPNHPEVEDITTSPVLGGGFVFKTASNQSYAWDVEALGAAISLCRKNDIAYQRFAKHSNQKGGGTIGSIISSHLPMKAVDMGVGILAMHSAAELMAKRDQVELQRFMRAYFSV